MDELVERCRTEVLELHAFFQQWFNGQVPRSPVSVRRALGAMAPSFTLIAPDGGELNREKLALLLRDGWSAQRDMIIEVRHLAPVWVGDGAALLDYEEWQCAGGNWQGRKSTALLRTDDDAPNGVVWVHVHETWLPKKPEVEAGLGRRRRAPVFGTLEEGVS